MPQKKWRAHAGEVIDQAGDYTVIACERCGFRHVTPIPDAAALEAVYRDQYYTDEKPRFITRHEEDITWWRQVYGERLALFERELPAGRRAVLDVGCGPGTFLRVAGERGWRGLGIEPSRAAARHAKGFDLEVIEDFLGPESAAGLGPFDAIHLSEVLEHLPDPAQMLGLVHDLLAPGGLVCLITPNDYNPFQRAARAALDAPPWWLAPPHHINYFDVESLCRLAQAAGFTIVAREATFPMELFLLMGENYIGRDSLGRGCHARRKAFDLALAAPEMQTLKREFYRSLAGLGLGREVMVVARKPEGGAA